MSSLSNNINGNHFSSVDQFKLLKSMAGFLPGYSDTLTSEASKRRYSDKLKLVDRIDPY